MSVICKPAARIHHDQRNVPGLFINGGHFALKLAVRSAILAMVGYKYDHRVVDYAIRQRMQRIEHSSDLAVHNLHDLRIAVEPPLPVAERHPRDPRTQLLIWIRLDAGRILLRIVSGAAPYTLREFVHHCLSGWFVVLQILQRFPIGRQRRVSVRLWGF